MNSTGTWNIYLGRSAVIHGCFVNCFKNRTQSLSQFSSSFSPRRPGYLSLIDAIATCIGTATWGSDCVGFGSGAAFLTDDAFLDPIFPTDLLAALPADAAFEAVRETVLIDDFEESVVEARLACLSSGPGESGRFFFPPAESLFEAVGRSGALATKLPRSSVFILDENNFRNAFAVCLPMDIMWVFPFDWLYLSQFLKIRFTSYSKSSGVL
mmetsp:Transcript_28660/g.58493  ORF Transcript_28660/g.58493 Transcript_28660/m.58493 type:complete len:211 (+) Transcript_28660:25-657(+)